MTILLTGASGFVGRNTYKSRSKIYRSVVRKGTKHSFEKIFEIDGLHSGTKWNGAFDGIDSVIHLAGLAHNSNYTDEEYFEVNTQGTLHFASEAVKSGVKRFVFVSSIGVTGTITEGSPINERSSSAPHNAYAHSKYRAEQGLRKLAKETGLELVIVRPTLVYGANAPGNFGSLTKLVGTVPFLPFGLVNNKRSFVSVDNLSDFIHTCAIHPKAAGETFVISDGNPVSIKGFTNAIAKGLGTFLIQLPIPVLLMNFAAKILGKSNQAKQLLGDFDVDSSKARTLLGWTPPETMLQAMVKLKKTN